ncbi:MAG: hypothetical protein AAF639_08470 [Chloroflexota bacterium]
MKSFSNWSTEDVEEEFGLKPQTHSKILDIWLNVETTFSDFEHQWLEQVRRDVEAYSYTWNEQELIAESIVPLLKLVHFQQESYRGFLNREISAPYANDSLSGEVDFIVAQGRHSPKRLFFFLHEYKKEPPHKDDPRGQLLIAMVAAQLLNQDENPLYGAYVVGRMWYFVVLEGKTYTVHRGFNASSQEIEQILGVLKNTRSIIERLLSINH